MQDFHTLYYTNILMERLYIKITTLQEFNNKSYRMMRKNRLKHGRRGIILDNVVGARYTQD